METFVKALKNNDIELLKTVCKTDLHNHGTFSCTRKYLIDNNIVLPNYDVTNIETLNSFIVEYLKPMIDNIETLPILLKGNFENCIETGIKFVTPTIDYKTCIRLFDNDILKFIDFLKSFKYDNLNIGWVLGMSRNSYIEDHKDLIIQLINSNFFVSIDLYGVENSKPNSLFIDFYNLANKKGLITKIHVGEQCGKDHILKCINDFNPKEIQHGIRIIEDENLILLAKEKNITFNVCPTSNIVLNYAENIKNHPIKIMYEYGLSITIGTDDLLFFNSDINNEYLKLFLNNVLSAEDLNKIRKNGLNIARNYLI